MDLKNASMNNLNNSYHVNNKRNSSVPRRKSEISAATIINSLERDINDLIQETTIRTQKNKLISLNETFKLLSKKISSTNTDVSLNSYLNPNNNGQNLANNLNVRKANNIIMDNSFSQRNEYTPNNPTNNISGNINLKFLNHNDVEEELKKAYDIELKKIRDEKNYEIDLIKKKDSSNEADLILIKKEKDDVMSKLNGKIETLNLYLNEEKNKNSQLLIKIKSLEETFKTLNNEYLSLNFRYSKAQTESENMEKSLMEIRKNNNDTKYKFEDLLKINNELKSRLVDYENTTKLHQDDLKNILKRNSSLQKNIEELEKVNKQIIADLSYKEERLRAIRLMNQKLEQKSNQILKKWDTFKRFEEKATMIVSNSNRMLEVIDELNKKLEGEIEEKESIKKSYDLLCNEKFQMNNLINELNMQISNLKGANEELIERNNNLETMFRGNLDIKNEFKDSKDNFKSNTFMKLFNMQNISNNSKEINNLENNNNTFGNDVTFERMNPAKIIINENNNVEIQH